MDKCICCYTVEKAKLNGRYKVLKRFNAFRQGAYRAATIAFDKTKLEEGEKKRLRNNGRTLKQLSCYWT